MARRFRRNANIFGTLEPHMFKSAVETNGMMVSGQGSVCVPTPRFVVWDPREALGGAPKHSHPSDLLSLWLREAPRDVLFRWSPL